MSKTQFHERYSLDPGVSGAEHDHGVSGADHDQGVSGADHDQGGSGADHGNESWQRLMYLQVHSES